MSSQILVYGCIEVFEETVQENIERLARLVAHAQPYPNGRGLASAITEPHKGFSVYTMSFALSLKKTLDFGEGEKIQKEFEYILKNLNAISARLNIFDEEGILDRYFDYIYARYLDDGNSMQYLGEECRWIRATAKHISQPIGELVE